MPSKTAATSLSTNNEMVESLEFLSDAYDDLRPFHSLADKEFKRLNKSLDDLYTRSNEIGTAADEIKRAVINII